MKYAPILNDEGKMITNSREKDFEAKAEGDTDNISKFNKAPSSSRQWSAFKNPRIVRVSRAFGGKDRHSKVCTVKGLRDRRIRLSVPTAIQLYDLQDRLGLSQPSKVVDWLLDATKHDIDKLPPLQIPPGSFTQFHQQNLVSPHHELNAPQSSLSTFFNPNPEVSKEGGITQSLLPNKEGIKINYNLGEEQLMGKSNAGMGGKLKEVERETMVDKTKWMRSNEEQSYIPQVSAQNFFPIASNLSAFPYNYYHFDPSSLSLSQFGHHGFPQSQTEGANASNLMSMPSSLSLPSGSQLFLSPPVATPSVFPTFASYISNPGENDTRQINHFPFLSSSSHQQSLPNPLMSSHHNSFSSQNDERQPDKGSSGS